MIILAIAGLYIFLSVKTILKGEFLNTKNKEKIRLMAIEIDQDAAIPKSMTGELIQIYLPTRSSSLTI